MEDVGQWPHDVNDEAIDGIGQPRIIEYAGSPP